MSPATSQHSGSGNETRGAQYSCCRGIVCYFLVVCGITRCTSWPKLALGPFFGATHWAGPSREGCGGLWAALVAPPAPCPGELLHDKVTPGLGPILPCFSLGSARNLLRGNLLGCFLARSNFTLSHLPLGSWSCCTDLRGRVLFGDGSCCLTPAPCFRDDD